MASRSPFIVVRGSSGKDSFEKEVNVRIEEGYVPIGSVGYDWLGGVYTLGMILRES